MTVLQYHNQEIDTNRVLCALNCGCVAVFCKFNPFKRWLKVFELLIDIVNIWGIFKKKDFCCFFSQCLIFLCSCSILYINVYTHMHITQFEGGNKNISADY